MKTDRMSVGTAEMFWTLFFSASLVFFPHVLANLDAPASFKSALCRRVTAYVNFVLENVSLRMEERRQKKKTSEGKRRTWVTSCDATNHPPRGKKGSRKGEFGGRKEGMMEKDDGTRALQGV